MDEVLLNETATPPPKPLICPQPITAIQLKQREDSAGWLLAPIPVKTVRQSSTLENLGVLAVAPTKRQTAWTPTNSRPAKGKVWGYPNTVRPPLNLVADKPVGDEAAADEEAPHKSKTKTITTKPVRAEKLRKGKDVRTALAPTVETLRLPTVELPNPTLETVSPVGKPGKEVLESLSRAVKAKQPLVREAHRNLAVAAQLPVTATTFQQVRQLAHTGGDYSHLTARPSSGPIAESSDQKPLKRKGTKLFRKLGDSTAEPLYRRNSYTLAVFRRSFTPFTRKGAPALTHGRGGLH